MLFSLEIRHFFSIFLSSAAPVLPSPEPVRLLFPIPKPVKPDRLLSRAESKICRCRIPLPISLYWKEILLPEISSTKRESKAFIFNNLVATFFIINNLCT